MFASLLLKLKSTLFGNLSSTFIVTLVAMLGLIVMFNADTVLTKFGMQTRSTLASELSKTQEQLKAVSKTNEDLNTTIATLRLNNQTTVDAVENNCKEAQIIHTQVVDGQTALDKRAQAIKKAPRKPQVASTETGATDVASPPSESSEDVLVLRMTNNLSPDQLNDLSMSNITAINTTYLGLFKKA